jgi:endonuclease/exonuclease/phosphatase family metal-dependent hydrolase
MIHTGVDAETAEALKVLIKRIEDSGAPPSKLDENIVVASWNIREFGRKRRTEKAIHCVAEILSWFDLVSIQELRGGLEDLRRVLDVLGDSWRVVYSDVTWGRQGNEERIGYLFDRRAVTFTGLAAEAVAPPVEVKKKKSKTAAAAGKKKKAKPTTYLPAAQFWRTPYIASFRAGTFDFILMSVHAQWGTEAGREEELGRVADWIQNWRASKFVEDKDIIVMGDFNIPKIGDRFYKAITRHKLVSRKNILEVPGGSNLDRDARYDQIFYYPKETAESVFTGKGGVVDFYRGDHKPLFPELDKKKFTYQLSDHLPLWLEVKTDDTAEKLDQIIKGGG